MRKPNKNYGLFIKTVSKIKTVMLKAALIIFYMQAITCMRKL